MKKPGRAVTAPTAVSLPSVSNVPANAPLLSTF
jgi:hypothetical protein